MEQTEIVLILCLIFFGLITMFFYSEKLSAVLRNAYIQRDIGIGVFVNASFLLQSDNSMLTGILVAIISIYAIIDAEIKKENDS